MGHLKSRQLGIFAFTLIPACWMAKLLLPLRMTFLFAKWSIIKIIIKYCFISISGSAITVYTDNVKKLKFTI